MPRVSASEYTGMGLSPEEIERRIIRDSQKKFRDYTSKFGPLAGTEKARSLFNAPEIIDLKTGERSIDWIDEAADEYERRQIAASHGIPTPKTPPRYVDPETGNIYGAGYRTGERRESKPAASGYDPYADISVDERFKKHEDSGGGYSKSQVSFIGSGDSKSKRKRTMRDAMSFLKEVGSEDDEVFKKAMAFLSRFAR